MGFNSTIRQKIGDCACGKEGVPLIGDKCHSCYWLAVRLKSAAKAEAKKPCEDEDFSDLISELDMLVSVYVRKKDADALGMAVCFTCGVRLPWKELECGHFVKRGNMFLRYDLRNLRPQCNICNCHKGGNLILYAQRLERENPGIVEILLEEGRLVYKFTREELRLMKLDFSQKIKLLQKN